MPPESILWLIFLLPFGSFLFISFVLRPFFSHRPQLSSYSIITALAVSFGFSVWVLTSSDHFPLTTTAEWVVVGDFTIRLGLWVDELTAIMLVAVTSISLLVQIYSQGYMHGDPGYPRYFAWMSLFTASMLGLVLGSNLLMVYIFWEGVGLCSYLLIGFWFHKPSAAAAAKKAFIVTRFGDFGFLAGILVLYFSQGTLEIAALNHLATIGVLGGTTLTLAALGIFSGAAGKSAQFPLHTWLPDAMEGPTPVSSLIHAATMVAAGVYLVARTLPMFAGSEAAVMVVAVIGGFTAIFAGSMAIVMNDIKRVIAYSTISQLGYMMLGLGAVGVAASRAHDIPEVEHLLYLGVAVGIFHLFTHAFFKCLLFLGAGSVNHSTGTFDMREMGGLRKYMPWTYRTFLAGSLALAGIWPFAGFWSKDEILVQAYDHVPVLFYLAMIAVFMTAFYIFRVIFMTFHGEYRGPKDEDGHVHLHESPWVMLFPMVVLAILAIIGGLFLVPEFLGGHAPGFFEVLKHPLPWASLLVAGSGILLAYLIYSAKVISAEKIGQTFAPLYKLFSHKYWLDELYEKIFVVRVLLNVFFRVLQLFDTYVVDGIVNGASQLVMLAGSVVRRAQTGQLQSYGLAIILGILVIMVVFLVYR